MFVRLRSGRLIDLNASTAIRLIRRGYAEPAPPQEKRERERAVVVPRANAAKNR